MLLPARAVENIDVRGLFIGVAFVRLDLVIFRVPAAARNLLVLLQCIDVSLLEEALRQIGNFHPWTSRDGSLGQHCAFGPTVAVTIGPAALCSLLSGRLGVADVERCEGMWLHGFMPA